MIGIVRAESFAWELFDHIQTVGTLLKTFLFIYLFREINWFPTKWTYVAPVSPAEGTECVGTADQHLAVLHVGQHTNVILAIVLFSNHNKMLYN